MNSAFYRSQLPMLAALFLAAAAQAQTPSAPAKPAATDAKKDEEALIMSEFTVKSEVNRGYVASETLTGTRVATQIKDLPYTVNVVTSEYFEDFGMFQLDDTLTQVGGLTGLDVGGNFNLRGFASSSQLRDGFYRLGRYGQTNIDRLEIIKGPNAGIYGRTSPGGMVNMVSKAPKKKEQIDLTLRYGENKTHQETLEATGAILSPSTYYILTLSQFERGYDQPFARLRENQGFLAVKHDFKNGGHLLASAEYFLQYRHAPTAGSSTPVPIVTDQKGTASTADDRVVGYASALGNYNPFGPYSELNRGSNTFLLTYDQRLNDIFSMRLAGQVFRARRWDYNQNTNFGAIAINPSSGAAPTTTRGAAPNKGYIQEDGGGVQLDNVANYNLFNGAVKNKTLVTVDVNDYYRWDPTWTTSNTPARVAWNAAGSGRVVTLDPNTLTPVAPLTYFQEPFTWGGEILTRLTRRRATVAGGQFRQESHWMNDKLLTYFGARYDAVRFHERDYTATINGVTGTTAAPVVVKRRVNQTKPNIGALYKILPSVRVYANYSESYFINQTDNPVDIAGDPSRGIEYKPETAKGWDFGVKGTFLDDRLTYTIGGYYIQRFNVTVSDTVEFPTGSGNFINITRRDGDQLDRGVEADINWSINPSWSTGLSYGHVNAIYTDFGNTFPQAVGRSVQNISPDNGSAYLKYAVNHGRLKGLSANIRVSYVSATPTETPVAGDPVPNAAGVVTGTSTEQWKLKVPSFTLWDIGVSYKLRTSERFQHTLRLNVNNIFNHEYLKVNKNLGDKQSVSFSYTLGFSR